MFSWQFITAIGILLTLIFIAGLLVWYFERNKNEEFSGSTKAGIGNGFWWSAVTMTTVGYGDKSPKTFWGRFIGFIWMFTAVIIISSLTASIASSLTVNSIDDNIKNVRDLGSKKVGTIAESSPSEFLDIFKLKTIKFESIEEGLNALKNNKLDYFVYDRTLIQYAINQNPELIESVVIGSENLKTDYYSFSFPKNSDIELISFINQRLIEELKSIEWRLELEELK